MAEIQGLHGKGERVVGFIMLLRLTKLCPGLQTQNSESQY